MKIVFGCGLLLCGALFSSSSSAWVTCKRAIVTVSGSERSDWVCWDNGIPPNTGGGGGPSGGGGGTPGGGGISFNTPPGAPITMPTEVQKAQVRCAIANYSPYKYQISDYSDPIYVEEFGWTKESDETAYAGTQVNTAPPGFDRVVYGATDHASDPMPADGSKKKTAIWPRGYMPDAGRLRMLQMLYVMAHEVAHQNGITSEKEAEDAGQQAVDNYIQDHYGAACK